MFRIIFTNKFDKDLKICEKRNYNLSLILEIIEHLQKNTKIPSKYKPHKLKGDYSDCWECHIKPDWLLIWEIDELNKTIKLTRTGTHSDLF